MFTNNKITVTYRIYSLYNADEFVRLIQDEFYKKLFPNSSQFEIESDFEFENEAETTTNDPFNINDRFVELVLASMLGFIILVSIRFLLRRMGCVFKHF